MLRHEDPDTTDADLAEQAAESLAGLVTLASYGMVKRISHAIGSPLLGKVYDLVRANDDAPAVGLVHTSLQLDQFTGFPEDGVVALYRELRGNALGINVLQRLVMNHFHVFELKFDLKQRVCAKLGIEYQGSLGLNPRTKLLTSGGAARS